MRIPWKLALIIVVLAVPIVVSVFLYVTKANEEIAKTGQELDAVRYLTPLRTLFEHVPQHRGTAQGFLSGDVTQRDRLTALAVQINTDLEAVETAELEVGAGLDSDVRYTAIRRTWRNLQQRFTGLSPAGSFNQHSLLIGDIMALMQHVANTGQLIGDPDLDSSYLIDTTVDRIPETAETLGVLRGLGNGIAARGAVTANERVRLSELVSRAQGGLAAIDRNLRIAFGRNPDLEAALAPKLVATIAAAQGFLGVANSRLIRTEQIDIPPNEYFTAGTQSLSRIFELYDGGLESLQQLLQTRRSALLVRIYTTAGFAIFLAIGAIIGALLFQRGITRQLAAIGETFSRIGIGDFGARVEVTSQDELGDLSTNLNAMLENTLTLIQTGEERDQIQASILKLLEEVSSVADGDLTAEAEVTAEVTGAIADSFNYMIEQLRQIISNVQDTTLQVSAAASEIQATTEHLAAGSESQSDQIVNTSAAIDEMAVSIQQVSESATSASAVAEQALNNAQDGNTAVTKTITGMNAIRQGVQETAKRIKRLGESSQEIGEIVQLIGDIADRTSILALNASIQAAMAGEAGRGFAVVAEEVERLADRSAEATKRIEGLIKTIQSETTEAVAAMEGTTQEVVAGSGLANEAGRSLEEIQAVSNRLAELITSITMAAKQQARGSESVATAMGDISEVTQQTAAGTKQAAVSISNLAELADSLRESVRAFKLPEKAA